MYIVKETTFGVSKAHPNIFNKHKDAYKYIVRHIAKKHNLTIYDVYTFHMIHKRDYFGVHGDTTYTTHKLC